MMVDGRWLAQLMGLDHTVITKPEDWTIKNMNDYNRVIIHQFTVDLKAAGFEVIPYVGRYEYRGVGVHTDENVEGRTFHDAIRATEVKLNSETYGMCGKVVYPALMQWPTYQEKEVARRLAAELEGQSDG